MQEVTTKRENRIYIGNVAVDILIVLFMIVFSIIMLYPFVNTIAVSLSSTQAISSGQVTWWPKEITTKGYEIVFGQNAIWRAYKNTIIYAGLYAIISLVVTSMISYALTIEEFFLRKPLTIFLLVTMFFSGGTIPTYLLIRNLNLMNTVWALVLPNAVSAYNVFVYRAFYRGISPEIRDAARIDGASEFGILLRIYVPLSKALYATFGLFAIVGIWNGYYDALLYLKDDTMHPIQMVLRKILFTSGAGGTFDGVTEMVQQGNIDPKNVQYASIVATIGPILLVYPFLQKHFTAGMQLGAVKG